MTGRPVDPEKLRAALRRLPREHLLMIADRAAGIVPRTKLPALLGDLVRLEELATTQPPVPASLLAGVRRFHAACLRGEYYESFNVNSKNWTARSRGTQAFLAEFDRLLRPCIEAASKPPWGPVREAFDLLFNLLRRIDEGRDDVVFFADEAGSWQVGVDWDAALPAYFRCLAGDAPAEEFVREVDQTIADFAEHHRPGLLVAARRVADRAQKAALRRLPRRGPEP